MKSLTYSTSNYPGTLFVSADYKLTVSNVKHSRSIPTSLPFIHHLIKISPLLQFVSDTRPSSSSSSYGMSSNRRARPVGAQNEWISDSSISDEDRRAATATETLLPPQQSTAQRAISQTLATTANLANLLPTGTLLAFQLLTPIFTNNGSCDSATGPMTFILLTSLAFSCFIACFTDSFKTPQGTVHYGFVTRKGLWLIDYPSNDPNAQLPDLRSYRLRFTDLVHAILSVFIFLVVAFRDKNVLNCFYPAPGHETQEVLSIAPVGVGIICSLLFAVFPTTRHGIGFPVTS